MYHISIHGPVMPRPLRPPYLGKDKLRPWMKDYPEEAVWLTPSWFEVMTNHGVTGKVHAYQVDNSLIDQAGGIHLYDGAPEIIFSGQIWNEAIESGKIKYLGSLNEEKLKEALPRKDNFPEAEYKRKLSPLSKRIETAFSNMLKRNDSGIYNQPLYHQYQDKMDSLIKKR